MNSEVNTTWGGSGLLPPCMASLPLLCVRPSASECLGAKGSWGQTYSENPPALLLSLFSLHKVTSTQWLVVCRWQGLKTPRTLGLRWEKFWGISKHSRALPVRVRPGLGLLHQKLLPSLAPSLSHSASHSSSLVSPGRVSLTNHIPQMFGSRSASERIQLKPASK